MKTIIYTGDLAEVNIPNPPVLAKRGEPVEVPDELAKELLTRAEWKAAEKKKPATEK